jgi:hypothetical protein
MAENPSAISEHWLPAGRKKVAEEHYPGDKFGTQCPVTWYLGLLKTESSLHCNNRINVLVMHPSIYQDGSICIKQDTRKGSAKGRLEAGAKEGFPASTGIQHQDAADSLHKL